MNIKERIHELAKERGISIPKLEEELNLGSGTISRWSKSSPSITKLLPIANYFNVSIDYLAGETNFKNIEHVKNHFSKASTDVKIVGSFGSHPLVQTLVELENAPTTKINVYGSIPAGYPIEAVEDIVDTIEIPLSWLRGDNNFIALKVKGDSMEPQYLNNDTVIIRLQPDCESGDDCACYINGYDATLKRVYKNETTITLQPLNPKYPPMMFGKGSDEVRILGKVVELRRSI